jgi:hypothetical protein
MHVKSRRCIRTVVLHDLLQEKGTMDNNNQSSYNEHFLNDSQRRGLSTALSVFEETLFEIEQVLQNKSYRGFLQDVVDDIRSPVKDATGEYMLPIKNTLKHLADSLQLEKRSVNAGKQVIGKLFYCLELLDEVKAKRLRRYGGIADGLEDVLDPQINTLISSITALIHLLQEGD